MHKCIENRYGFLKDFLFPVKAMEHESLYVPETTVNWELGSRREATKSLQQLLNKCRQVFRAAISVGLYQQIAGKSIDPGSLFAGRTSFQNPILTCMGI